MPRIFLPSVENSHAIRIAGEKARYLVTVMRCKEGDRLEVLDGTGLSYNAKIVSVTGKEVVAEVTGVSPSDAGPSLNLTLVQGLLKGEKMDLVIQKTTELGIVEIIPAVTERSQVRATRKTARWQKIAEDASRQCGRRKIPVIHEPVPFPSLFSRDLPHDFPSAKSRGIFLWEQGGMKMTEARKKLEECVKLIICVGPEGGFSPGEAALAQSGGFLVVSLGNRILRAETAAISVVAIVQFLFGDLA
jgi:16S rRNA (uracil1498-N3)-methyltransferase